MLQTGSSASNLKGFITISPFPLIMPLASLPALVNSPMIIVKEFDYSSPYLYKAVATGQNLKSAEIKWYKISDAGQEVEYFNMLLEGVRIVSISPTMASPEDKNNNHLESVELRYEKITGNIVTEI